MATVLSKIIGIGVGESTVGPAVLEIINALLRHLQVLINTVPNIKYFGVSLCHQYINMMNGMIYCIIDVRAGIFIL